MPVPGWFLADWVFNYIKNYAKYIVFRDLKDRGFVIKTGFKYGSEFRLYNRGGGPGQGVNGQDQDQGKQICHRADPLGIPVQPRHQQDNQNDLEQDRNGRQDQAADSVTNIRFSFQCCIIHGSSTF